MNNKKTHVHVLEWKIQRSGVKRYVEEYRFVNLDQVPLHKTFVWSVDGFFYHIHQLFGHGDCSQIILEAVSMHDFLYCPTVNVSNMNIGKHLEWVIYLLKSSSPVF